MLINRTAGSKCEKRITRKEVTKVIRKKLIYNHLCIKYTMFHKHLIHIPTVTFIYIKNRMKEKFQQRQNSIGTHFSRPLNPKHYFYFENTKENASGF